MRRVFTTAVLLLAAVAAGCTSGPPAGEAPGAAADAVVLIVVDTLRADHLGAYGYDARPTSPELDRWAGRGLLFERAWAASSWTLPSFGSLLTGRLPSAHAVGTEVADDSGADFMVAAARNFVSLPEGIATLPEMLGAHGFATGALLSNPFLDPGFGLGRGFAYYDNYPASNADLRRAADTVDQALAWLDGHAGHPAFLLVHLFDPHLDYDAPPPFRGRFTGTAGDFDLPVANLWPIRNRIAELGAAERAFIAAAYDEEIATVDAELGRLLAGLQQRGVLRRGLVVLTADHGEELFEHGGFEHGHAMYEEVLRVPLILWGAGVAPARDDTPVSLIDVAPTVLAAAGVDAGDLPGVSLLDADRDRRPAQRDLIAERLLYGPETKVIVRWPFKVIARAKTGSTLLFDLQADPGERHDLAAERPEQVRELLGALAEKLAAAAALGAAAGVELDDQLLRRLRALGYIR